MPIAPAHSSVATTLRRSTNSATAAPASTPACHASLSASASVTAAPRIAPIAAGPAPSRNARALAFSRRRRKRSPPSRMNENEGVNATTAARMPPPRPCAAYPTAAIVATTGPGVTWPSATALRNSALVIQW